MLVILTSTIQYAPELMNHVSIDLPIPDLGGRVPRSGHNVPPVQVNAPDVIGVAEQLVVEIQGFAIVDDDGLVEESADDDPVVAGHAVDAVPATQHPQTGPVANAGGEIAKEEEAGHVAADDRRRRELDRVRESVVP